MEAACPGSKLSQSNPFVLNQTALDQVIHKQQESTVSVCAYVCANVLTQWHACQGTTVELILSFHIYKDPTDQTQASRPVQQVLLLTKTLCQEV